MAVALAQCAALDVWEVIGLLRSLDTTGEAAIVEAARWLGLAEAQVRATLGYYGMFPDEIDTRITANQAAAERAQREWEIQQRLLG